MFLWLKYIVLLLFIEIVKGILCSYIGRAYEKWNRFLKKFEMFLYNNNLIITYKTKELFLYPNLYSQKFFFMFLNVK